MKIVSVVVFILFLSIGMNVLMDIGIGLEFSRIVNHLLNPFWVMGPGEYVMLVFLFLIIIGQQTYFIMKNKSGKEDGSS